MKTGKVYLVGAGPGDPDLISVKGINCLKRADTVIYDRLLDERLLEMAPPGAERIYVGKAAGEHTLPQDKINRLLVDKSKEGKTVVRLKGGDPFVLGRGGEEAGALEQNDISFEIVPGITSAVAVPAYAGIPVTHRGVASSFAVITGHEEPGKETSSINWENLATGIDTLVFLMGLKNLPEITARLAEYGRPSDTPVAVIKDGTRPEQVTVTGRLDTITDIVRDQKLTSPAIIVVGEVVGLREKLGWFDNRPLSGKRVLVTRARRQASALSQLLTEKGAQPVELPAIDIQPLEDTSGLDGAIRSLSDYDWIIFTSVNGVSAFWERLRELKLDSRALNGLKIGAIGPATADDLEAEGITADFIPEIYTGEGIITGLKNRGVTGQRFLLPRADIADNALVEGIQRLGATVRVVAAYRTVPDKEAIARAREMLKDDRIDIITFTSSSTVSNLVEAFGEERLALNGVKVACIGPKTAETAVRAKLKVDIIAGEQTIPGLVTSLEEYFTIN